MFCFIFLGTLGVCRGVSTQFLVFGVAGVLEFVGFNHFFCAGII